jgi:hypothetical protein
MRLVDDDGEFPAPVLAADLINDERKRFHYNRWIAHGLRAS